MCLKCKILLILLFIISFISCQNAKTEKKIKNEKQEKSSIQMETENIKIFAIDIAKANILENQSINDLQDLAMAFNRNFIPMYEILPYAFYIEKDYKEDAIYYNIFLGIVSLSLKKHSKELQYFNLENLKYVDKNDLKLALSYLEKGADQNFDQCLLKLEKIYENGYGVEKDIEKAEFYRDKRRKIDSIFHVKPKNSN